MEIYPIEKGDTLSEIAEKFAIPLKAILFVNPQIVDPDKIRAGDYIYIPDIIQRLN